MLDIQGQGTKPPSLFFQRKSVLVRAALTAVLGGLVNEGLFHVSLKALFSLDAEDLFINFWL